MIQIIVFSFNRALQLDALLASVQQHWRKTAHRLAVLYNTSNDEFQTGYKILEKKYPQYQFIKETNGKRRYPCKDYLSFFNLKKLVRYKHCRYEKSNFRDLLTKIVTESAYRQIMFLTDDSIFIREVEINDDILEWINQDPNQNSFSLRLGQSINTPQKQLPSPIRNIISWDYSDYDKSNNWGYRFSVDGHIYSRQLILKLINNIIFNNPSTLEAHLHNYTYIHNLLNKGKTGTEPYLLSYPINMVQTIVNNKSLGVSETLLNEYFLHGKHLIYPIPEHPTKFQQYPEHIVLEGVSDTEEFKINYQQ